MKNLVKILSLALILMMSLFMICSCGGDSTDSSSPQSTPNSDNGNDVTPSIVDYVIKATDYKGEVMQISVIVEVFKDGESLGKKALRRGSATFSFEEGDYTFTLSPNSDTDKFYYDTKSCKLTKDEREKTIVLYPYADKEETLTIYPNNVGDNGYEASVLNEGATYVEIDRPEMTYFVFTPTRGGIYKFSYIASKAISIGYYGSPQYIWNENIQELDENGFFQLEIKDGSVNIGGMGGTAQYVIGIRTFAVDGCVLKIERVGDATVELPWENVQIDKNATQANGYINNELVDFDVTDKNLTVVYSQKDGYYHLNTEDGPVIYIKLTVSTIKSQNANETIYAFLPPIVKMCETDNLGKVFYDEDGNIISKESYNEMFNAYAEISTYKGVYPLNKQLANAIKNVGEHKRWFDLSYEFNIFGDIAKNVVSENAWLFACCYENDGVYGVEGKPGMLTPTAQDAKEAVYAEIKANEALYLRAVKQGTISVYNAQGVKLVVGEEEISSDENGKITATINANQTFTLVYTGEEAEITVYLNFVS